MTWRAGIPKPWCDIWWHLALECEWLSLNMKGHAMWERLPTKFDLCLHFSICAQNLRNVFWICPAMSDWFLPFESVCSCVAYESWSFCVHSVLMISYEGADMQLWFLGEVLWKSKQFGANYRGKNVSFCVNINYRQAYNSTCIEKKKRSNKWKNDSLSLN